MRNPTTSYPAILETLSTVAEIESAIGKPGQKVLAKVLNALDDICRSFIARSPFIVVASCDAAGNLDVSPKGDPAGFVHVLDDHTIAIPERLGNRRGDTFRNVLQNPKVGVIFIVPGKGETLRISGRARIVRDPWLRERLKVADRVPELALVVTVEEAFLHCTKCMVRSKMWKPETWNSEGLASIGEAMVVHGHLDVSIAEMRAFAENDEQTRLY
jgi:PPOX class probable FMN-dependent enzyme